MNVQLIPSSRTALHGLIVFGLLSLTVFSSCEVPADPFKDGKEQQVHDGGMYPKKDLPDTTDLDRMDTATNPTMDGKP